MIVYILKDDNLKFIQILVFVLIEILRFFFNFFSFRCTDVDGKLSQMKSSAKRKEMALEKTVCELTNQVEAQKKRICDLTLICTKQRDLLRENENCISTKIVQLTEAEDKIQSTNCRCKQLQEQIENLQCRLNEEMNDRENLERQLDERQDNCNCELQIKNKIIEDQIETIKKLKAVNIFPYSS